MLRSVILYAFEKPSHGLNVLQIFGTAALENGSRVLFTRKEALYGHPSGVLRPRRSYRDEGKTLLFYLLPHAARNRSTNVAGSLADWSLPGSEEMNR